MIPISKQAEELFQAVLKQPHSEREAFLDAVCGDDTALRERVASLLNASNHADAFFDRLSTRIGLKSVFDGDIELPQSETIGSYRLIRLIGRGGMGAVYLAERDDKQFEKRVALKILPVGIGHEELRQRFLAERQMLAQLVHPGIARLLDGGVTEQGTPYFVMDYVEGVSIDEYCDANQLGLDQRLRLFCKVCEAVQYAHNNLIVHRDLKPGNVLVEASGEVKLLDFGIAKVIDSRSSPTEPIEMGARIMTPNYASPEMIRGDAITTASDVFALGVLLYHLTTGQYPYQPTQNSRGTLDESVFDSAAPRPSDVATGGISGNALRGDIDAIILKSVNPIPAERYPTANALIADLSRHLSGQPVLAHVDSAAYRASKFVRRNRLVVATTATVFVALLAGAAVASWQAGVAREEQRRAEQVKTFVVSMFEDADPYHGDGGLVSAQQLLRQASKRIDVVSAHYPALRLELRNLIGAGLVSLGDVEYAEKVIIAARDETRQEFSEGDSRVIESSLIAADLYLLRGDTSAMRSELDRVFVALESPARDVPRLRVWALSNLAHLEILEGSFDSAFQAARASFDLAIQSLSDGDPRRIESALTLAEAYVVAAPVGQKSLLDSVNTALAVVDNTYRDRPAHPYRIQAHQVRGRALAVDGFMRRAVDELENTVTYASETFGTTNLLVADYASGIAPYQRRIGDVSSALASSDRALDIYSSHVDRQSFIFGWNLTTRGVTLLAARRANDAVRDLAEAEQILKQMFGATHWETLTARFNGAIALAYLGRHAEAIKELDPIRSQPDIIANRMWALHVLGIVERMAGNYQAAVDAQTESLSLIVEGPRSDWDHVRNLAERGLAALELGRIEDSAADLVKAKTLFETLDTYMHPARAEVLVGLGRIELLKGRPKDALVFLKDADRFWSTFDSDNRWAGEAAYWLATCYETLGDHSDANATRVRAQEIFLHSPLPAHRVLPNAHERD